MKTTIIILLTAVMSLPAFAGGKPKVEICHFDQDYGVWKLISISNKAVNQHLTKHDDGLPGGKTLGTETPLDEACTLQALTCPCWSGMTVEELAAAIQGWALDSGSGFEYYECATHTAGGVGESNWALLYGSFTEAPIHGFDALYRVESSPTGYCKSAQSGTVIEWLEDGADAAAVGFNCVAELLDVMAAAGVCP
jgi:hypothetical protein